MRKGLFWIAKEPLWYFNIVAFIIEICVLMTVSALVHDRVFIIAAYSSAVFLVLRVLRLRFGFSAAAS